MPGLLTFPNRGGAALPHEAVFHVRAADARRSDALRRSLAVEAADPLPGARVSVEADADPCVFVVRVVSDDLVHLRAATNSYLKWLKAADGALAAPGSEKPKKG